MGRRSEQSIEHLIDRRVDLPNLAKRCPL